MNCNACIKYGYSCMANVEEKQKCQKEIDAALNRIWEEEFNEKFEGITHID